MKIFAAAGAMKGTLSCLETERIFNSVFDDCPSFSVLPVSDGGDSFLSFVKRMLPEMKERRLRTISCDGESIYSKVLVSKNCAFIESSLTCGIMKKFLPITQRTSEGVGILIKKLYDLKRTIYVGIGGTLTCDIGYGMLKALNVECSSYEGTNILKDSKKSRMYSLLAGIADVNSPLEGEYGAVMYLKQKRATTAEIKRIKNLLCKTSRTLNACNMKHAGSGGGLGLAMTLAGGRVADNFDFIDLSIGVKKRIKEADVVIVNEGAFDLQSKKGKLTGRIVEEALRQKKKAVIIAGGFNETPRGALEIKVKEPQKPSRENYIRNFYCAVKKTKELLYG